MNRYKDIHEGYMQHLINQHRDEMRLMDDRYKASVQHLKDEISELKNTEKDLRAVILQKDKKIEKGNKRRRWLTALIIVENAVFIGVFLYDYFNRNVGWIRSLYHTGDSIFSFIKS